MKRKNQVIYPTCPRQNIPQDNQIVDANTSFLYIMIESQYHHFAGADELVDLSNDCEHR